MNKKLVALVALLVVAVGLAGFIYGAGFTIVEKPVEKDYGPWVDWERERTTDCEIVSDGWIITVKRTSSTMNRISATLQEVQDLNALGDRVAFFKSGALPGKFADAWVEMDGERIDFPVVINPGEAFAVKVKVSADEYNGGMTVHFVVVIKLERPVLGYGDTCPIGITVELP